MAHTSSRNVRKWEQWIEMPISVISIILSVMLGNLAECTDMLTWSSSRRNHSISRYALASSTHWNRKFPFSGIIPGSHRMVRLYTEASLSCSEETPQMFGKPAHVSTPGQAGQYGPIIVPRIQLYTWFGSHEWFQMPMKFTYMCVACDNPVWFFTRFCLSSGMRECWKMRTRRQ